MGPDGEWEECVLAITGGYKREVASQTPAKLIRIPPRALPRSAYGSEWFVVL
jgi:hypothetical protein